MSVVWRGGSEAHICGVEGWWCGPCQWCGGVGVRPMSVTGVEGWQRDPCLWCGGVAVRLMSVVWRDGDEAHVCNCGVEGWR